MFLGRRFLFIFYYFTYISFCGKIQPGELQLTKMRSGELCVVSCDPAFGIPEKLIAKSLKEGREYSLNIISLSGPPPLHGGVVTIDRH